jgi:outer membrane protein assembly factor BamB
VVNETLATGPGEGGNIHLFDVKSTETIVRTPGRALVVDGRTAFILRAQEIAALNRDRYVQGQGLQQRWTTPCPQGEVMIKVGDRLVVGGESGIAVFAADSGEQTASIPLPPGTIEGLAFHAGRLLASMADGSIHCLAESDTEPAAVRMEPVPLPVTPKALDRARELAEWGQFDQGWALVDGVAAAEFAHALTQTTALRVVLAESDPAKADWLRQIWAKSGLLGTRIAVHTVAADALPYRPYLFNLVVTPNGPTPELARVVRPLGGRLVALAPGSVDLPGESVPPPAGFAFAFVRGTVPGSGEWTHCYGDPGNTACSGDQVSFGDFAVLWYGRPGPRYMYERHVKSAAPLYRNGTIFVNGKGYLAGVDAYNGAVLWEKHLEGAGRMALLKDCGNMVTADDRLFVAAGGSCLAIAARSGEEVAQYPVATYASPGQNWGYMAAWQDLLIGSATRDKAVLRPDDHEDYETVWKHFKPVVTSLSLFGLDRGDGTPRWRYEPAQGVVLNPTLGIVDGLLCFVESTNPATREHETGKIPLAELFTGGPRLTALRAVTGEVVWSVPIDLSAFQHAIYLSGKDGMIVLTGSRHDLVGEQRLIQYQMIGVDASNGREVWRNDNTPTRAHILDGGHGEQTQHPTIVGSAVYGPGFIRDLRTGEEIKGWQWNKSPQCATVSSSATCVFSRQGGNPTIAEVATGKEYKLTRVTRPSCWINTLPVGGIVVIPEGSSGCTCGYSLQTSLALVPTNP